ncbi:hypothetical protein N3C_0846 [Clostridium sp. N3C]|nr:hypothetical protein N3C_0846 [Clostridium sp. N3C]
MENFVDGLCLDYKSVLDSIKDYETLNNDLNKIGYLLGEFDESYPIDYIDYYDLHPEDFFKLT